jgi:hypothetical protein
MNQITIDLPPEALEQLEELAVERQLLVNEYVRMMVLERLRSRAGTGQKRRPGSAAGVIILAPDSDAPHLPETLAHFGL